MNQGTILGTRYTLQINLKHFLAKLEGYLRQRKNIPGFEFIFFIGSNEFSLKTRSVSGPQILEAAFPRGHHYFNMSAGYARRSLHVLGHLLGAADHKAPRL